MKVYRLLEDTAIAKEGSIGICVGTYELGGKYILFSNGNFDGFNYIEQSRFLTEIGEEEQTYNFFSAMHLSQDFATGTFDEIFKRYNLLDED